MQILGYLAHFLPLAMSPGLDLCGHGAATHYSVPLCVSGLIFLTSGQQGEKGVNHEPGM